ncbi:MAG: hypothetical protein F2837_10435 [Actinobacteria bacterium]|nr:hypothetical protein [Actinomycetota bacterium]
MSLAIRDSSVEGVAASETDWAFRALLSLADGLAASDPTNRVVLGCVPPPLTGDSRIDAAIAAVVEHFLEGNGVVTDWVHDAERVLEEPWIPDPSAGLNIAHEAPAAFQRHGVLLAERELGSI